MFAPCGAHQCCACARRGGSRHGGLASGGAAEDQSVGRQISGYTQGWPALRRLRQLPAVECMQVRSRRDRPQRLVPAVCREDLALQTVSGIFHVRRAAATAATDIRTSRSGSESVTMSAPRAPRRCCGSVADNDELGSHRSDFLSGTARQPRSLHLVQFRGNKSVLESRMAFE